MTNIYSNQEDRTKETLNTIYNNYFVSALAATKYFRNRDAFNIDFKKRL